MRKILFDNSFLTKSIIEKLALILVICCVTEVFAESQKDAGKLIATTVSKGGDCISSAIYRNKSSYELNVLDKKQCVEDNKDNKMAETECMEYEKYHKEIKFFIDYCGEEANTSPFYIGINGKTYHLNRVGKSPTKLPYLVGDYSGHGFKVRVKFIRILKETYAEGARKKDEGSVDEYQYESLVIIVKDGVTQKVKGVADEGS